MGGGAVWKGNVIGRIGPARCPDPITCGHAPNESVHSCTKSIFIIMNSCTQMSLLRYDDNESNV